MLQGSTAGLGNLVCIGCGLPFTPSRWNQLRCRPGCGKNHARQLDQRTAPQRNKARDERRAGPPHFIGVDGEGVTDPPPPNGTGEHRYVQLGCGNKSLSFDGAQLHFGEVLGFLWGCFLENQEAVFVGFYLGYDFTQWFKTLPEEKARRLLTKEGIAARQRKETEQKHLPPWPVDYEGWQFDILAGRRFKFRPASEDRRTGGKGRWCYICDVGQFFQCSFLKAIRPDPKSPLPPIVTQEEYALIEEGKARRASAEFDPAMVEYNRLECEVLARLMDRHAAGVRGEGLKLKRPDWIGPGQVAQAWLKKIGAPKGQTVRDVTPEAVMQAGQGSFFGGWFEQFGHGPFPEGWGYDINSCYPDEMSRLPCLLHGRWEHHQLKGGRVLNKDLHEKFQGNSFELVYAYVKGHHKVVGAMQHRLPQGIVLRPNETQGWFWGFELRAAIRAHFVDTIKVFEVWHYHKCDCPPPLAAIAGLYEERLRVGKGTVEGTSKKLIYNSCAGKFQQSVGEPPFGNSIYASAITAGCRAKITEAIATHPTGARDLLMVATDGVVFKKPHPRLPLDKERLGAWTETRHDNLSLFMPGVYWDDAARERIAAGEAPIFKSRGISAKDFAKHIAKIDEAWERFDIEGWPKLTLPISFQVISAKQALQRDWKLCGTISDTPRQISANPERKRLALFGKKSQPWPTAKGGVVSVPYEGRFGDERRAQTEADYGDHPEGPIPAIRTEMLKE